MMEENSCGGLGRPSTESDDWQRQPQLCTLDSTEDTLTVSVDDSVFAANKALLAQHCEYFRALFRSGMRECGQREVRLSCLGSAGFALMLEVLRGERPMLCSDEIQQAVECAAFLQVRALAKHLADIVDSENCLLMYHTASAYGVLELSHSSALFIRDMYPDLRRDVQAWPGQLVEYIESLIPSSYMAVCSHSPSVAMLQNFQRTVCYLDEEAMEWKVLTHLPMSASTTMAGVAELDNKLYIIGGVHDMSKKVVDSGFCYDPATNAWSTVPGPRQPRYNSTLIGHEGCLYAVGGEYDRKTMSSMEKYRPSLKTWNFASHLPYPAASVASAKTMSRIFICLWRAKGATEIHEYVPEKDQWVLVTTLVRQHSYGLCMMAHRDNLYVMRNGPSDDFLLCVMERYSLTSGQWTAMPGQYGNSKGSLFTAVVRGDSVFTLNRMVTTEYTIEDRGWKTKREMKGFGRIGSMHTFLMRLPKTATSLARNSKLTAPTRQDLNDFLDGPRSSVQCFENVENV